MTSKVLGIDLRDAGRDGLYRIVPDDPATLVDDATRAGLRLLRTDLAEFHDKDSLARHLAKLFELPAGVRHEWDDLAGRLRELEGRSAPGYVLLFDHAHVMQQQAKEPFVRLCQLLTGVAKAWHERGVPFFVFMEFPDNETRDAAIDA
jgi:hypothetical protein